MIEITERPAATMYLQSYDTPRVVDGKTLSRYQANVLHFIEHGHGDGIVGAVAGSGKTTTLVMVAKILTSDGLFVAFNKSIADELAVRLARVKSPSGAQTVAKTLHSIGMGALTKAYGRLTVDKEKYRTLADEEVFNVLPAGLRGNMSAERAVASTLAKLCDMARLTLTVLIDAEAVTDMCEQYGIDVPAHDSPLVEDQELRAAYIAAAERMIAKGEYLATTHKAHVIDFTDMIYLPVKLGVRPVQAAFVMVDECQDLNRAQLELVMACRQPGGRMLFVGDSRQAIYGFAGADCDSFWTIQKRTAATLLNLSVCYRCPTSIVELARDIVPEIEAAPGASAGTIRYVKESLISRELESGDMIVCRMTAPLVSLCMKLIAQRLPAKVKGRDIGVQITSMIKKVLELPGASYATFGSDLVRFQNVQELRLSGRKDADAQIEQLRDRCEALRMCYENFTEATDGDSLRAMIESLFTDEKKPAIMLSTVHKAKGLENGRVFILRPERMPLVWKGQTPDQYEQEMNLRYVAITRAQRELVFVEDDSVRA